MDPKVFDVEGADIAWCPGCGDYSILKTVKETLSEMEINPQELVFVSGIGQAGKLPHYLKANVFNGLHGRSLPVSTAIKAVNPELIVINVSGDGCTYGEGGNHFIHNIRRNPDITNIVHNNMVYGLTKGQASPTSQRDFNTPLQIEGVALEPFNPLAIAISLNASFVARAFSGDTKETKEILKKAIKHKGFAIVEMLQDCLIFHNDPERKKRMYKVENNDNFDKAVKLCTEFDYNNKLSQIPIGILYQKEKSTFDEAWPQLKKLREQGVAWKNLSSSKK